MTRYLLHLTHGAAWLVAASLWCTSADAQMGFVAPMPELCSVSGGPECTVLDFVVLERALADMPLSPGISQTCEPAIR